MNTISFIGSGNVATHLALVFRDVGFKINQIYSRSKENAELLAMQVGAKSIDSLSEIDKTTDVFFLCVKDDSILELCSKLSLSNRYVFHTSGSVAMNTLSRVSDNFGVFYPLQSFTKSKRIDFSSIPLCIEASNEETKAIARLLAERLSSNVREISSEQRQVIHLAAVFACNFSNHMYTIAHEILAQYSLPISLLQPLIEETAERLKSEFTPSQLQTGPAKRNDKKIMSKQLHLLKDFPDYKQLYELISKSIVQKHK